MKKILAASLLSLLVPVICSLPVTAKPAQWVRTVTEPPLTTFVDVASIRRVKNIRFYWEKTIDKNRRPLAGKGSPLIYGLMSYNSLDCKGNVMRTRIVRLIGAKDKVLYTSEPEDQSLQKADRGSFSSAAKKLVCNR